MSSRLHLQVIEGNGGAFHPLKSYQWINPSALLRDGLAPDFRPKVRRTCPSCNPAARSPVGVPVPNALATPPNGVAHNPIPHACRYAFGTEGPWIKTRSSELMGWQGPGPVLHPTMPRQASLQSINYRSTELHTEAQDKSLRTQDGAMGWVS